MDDEFGLGGVINQFIEYSMDNMNTAIPAIVLAVKDGGDTLFLDVQPSVSILTKEGETISETSILNVPMQQPASSVGGMVFPVVVGDSVLLVFSQRGVDTWKYGNGSPAAPSDFRKFSRRDCFAIPCVFPKSLSMASPTRQSSNYELGDVIVYNNRPGNSVEIILKKSGDVIVNSPGKVQINCNSAEVNSETDALINVKQDAVIKSPAGETSLSGGGWAQMVINGPLLIKSNDVLRLQGPSGSMEL
jgi:hypothetical protein